MGRTYTKVSTSRGCDEIAKSKWMENPDFLFCTPMSLRGSNAVDFSLHIVYSRTVGKHEQELFFSFLFVVSSLT